MKEYEQTPEQKIRAYQIKIDGMETEINLLKMRLHNAESRVLNQMMLRGLDKLIGISEDAKEAKQLAHHGLVAES